MWLLLTYLKPLYDCQLGRGEIVDFCKLIRFGRFRFWKVETRVFWSHYSESKAIILKGCADTIESAPQNLCMCLWMDHAHKQTWGCKTIACALSISHSWGDILLRPQYKTPISSSVIVLLSLTEDVELSWECVQHNQAPGGIQAKDSPSHCQRACKACFLWNAFHALVSVLFVTNRVAWK